MSEIGLHRAIVVILQGTRGQNRASWSDSGDLPHGTGVLPLKAICNLIYHQGWGQQYQGLVLQVNMFGNLKNSCYTINQWVCRKRFFVLIFVCSCFGSPGMVSILSSYKERIFYEDLMCKSFYILHQTCKIDFRKLSPNGVPIKILLAFIVRKFRKCIFLNKCF